MVRSVAKFNVENRSVRRHTVKVDATQVMVAGAAARSPPLPQSESQRGPAPPHPLALFASQPVRLPLVGFGSKMASSSYRKEVADPMPDQARSSAIAVDTFRRLYAPARAVSQVSAGD